MPLGDRRAIDALIATHGVIMETGARVLWVSEAPHLLGKFRPFELRRLLAEEFDPTAAEVAPLPLPEDPLLSTGQYAAWRALQP